jgi:phosphoglycerate dehydrogenase-like enzyme
VFDIEPLPADSPWRNEAWDAVGKSRVLLTPHMGYVEEGTMQTWYEETAENVERLVEGKDLLHCIT